MIPSLLKLLLTIAAGICFGIAAWQRFTTGPWELFIIDCLITGICSGVALRRIYVRVWYHRRPYRG